MDNHNVCLLIWGIQGDQMDIANGCFSGLDECLLKVNIHEGSGACHWRDCEERPQEIRKWEFVIKYVLNQLLSLILFMVCVWCTHVCTKGRD